MIEVSNVRDALLTNGGEISLDNKIIRILKN